MTHKSKIIVMECVDNMAELCKKIDATRQLQSPHCYDPTLSTDVLWGLSLKILYP